MKQIVLEEWSRPVPLEIGAAEHRVLEAHREYLTVERRPDGGESISAHGYVGSVALSPQVTVSVRPKVPLTAFLDLVALAYSARALPLLAGRTFASVSTPIDWLLLLLVTEVDRVVSGGLRAGYVAMEDETPYIRGRILFGRSVTQLEHPGRIACEFAEFVADTTENRVLRNTLESLFIRTGHDKLRSRAMRTIEMFRNVSVVPLTYDLFQRIELSRANQHYGPALELCRLAFDQRGIAADPGHVATPSFFFPMDAIFEQAVTNHLRRTIGGLTAQPSDNKSFRQILGHPRRITVQPDIRLERAQSSLVIDTKYKTPTVRGAYGNEILRNPDIYQAVTYGLAFKCPVLLVYPQVDERMLAGYAIGPVEVTVCTVDLSLPAFAGLYALSEIVQTLLRGQPLNAPTGAASATNRN